MILRTIVNSAVGNALDLLYPADLYCICCGKIIDDTRPYHLCDECMDTFRWAGDRTCSKCGRLLSPVNTGELCFNCKENEHSFDSGHTCAEYSTCERAVIFSLKYNGKTYIADTLGEIMYDRMAAEYGSRKLRRMYDMVTPVPIHRHKKSIRGFDQAALIAESFADRAGLDIDETILIRTRETQMMRSLSPDQRRENIRGAFAIRERRKKDIAGKSILIVDDIYTTGSTTDEIARLLRDAGAVRIDFLTFAAGADMIRQNS